MTITVRQLRHGTVVRLTGAHAQALNGLLIELLGRAELLLDVLERHQQPAKAPERVPDRSETAAHALGAGAASDGSQPA